MLFHTFLPLLLGIILPAATPAADAVTEPLYRSAPAPRPPVIDGKLDDATWKSATWTEDFPDIHGDDHPAPALRTRAKLLWDDSCLYVAFECVEPNVRASMRKHDAPLYRENAVELFLDPSSHGTNYCEMEINALGTTYDTRLNKPYSAGGQSDDAFELKEMKLAVHVDGTLNNPSDQDKGWTVEMAIPWKALQPLTAQTLPPAPMTRWRMELARVEHTLQPRRMIVSAWSPIGKVDLHVPEKWGWIEFVAASSPSAAGR